MIIGLALWCCILPACICNNERIALKQAKLQGRATRHCVIVDDDAVDRTPIEDLEGHIVFVSGVSTCGERLQDNLFSAVASTDCVKLRRIVEMYQWVEHEDDNDGNKTYHWTLEWRDSEQVCPNAGWYGRSDIQNPPMPIPSTQRSLDDYRAHVGLGDGNGDACAEASHGGVRMGAYYLGEYLRRELVNWQEKRVGPAEIQSCNELRGMQQPQQIGQHWVYGPNNMIGSVRVRFEELRCGPVSVCGILDHTATGWGFVPVFREDQNNSSETLAEEFGCRQGRCPICPAGEELHFTADEGDDEELLGALDRHAPELTLQEREQFRTAETSYNQPWYKVDADDNTLIKGMHFLGLEEEFLGVKEEHMTHDELMHLEGTMASAKHNCARCCFTCTGILACFCILSPITTFFNSNWLIYILGGGCISCVLQCMACILSLLCTSTLMMCAWFKERPRATCIVMTVLVLVLFLIIVIMRTLFPPEDAHYAQWNANTPGGYNNETGAHWGASASQR